MPMLNNSIALKELRRKSRMTPEEKTKFRQSKAGQRSFPKEKAVRRDIENAEVSHKICPRCNKDKHISDYRWKRDQTFSSWCIVCLDKDRKLRKKQKNRKKALARARRRNAKISAENNRKKRDEIIARMKQREKDLKEDIQRRLKMKQYLFNQWIKSGGFHEFIEANRND